jgi:hypothetical protein
VGLGRRTLAWSLCLAPAWSEYEAAAEEIETRAAIHLALQHFQAIDMALDRPGTPGQGDRRFDRGIVLVQPCGEALYGLQRTGRGALQPGIKGRGLPLAHELRQLLGEINRLGDLGLLRP